jgi:N-methylhydantoinase A
MSRPAHASVLFDGHPRRTAIYERDELRPSRKYAGPAIITEYSATTVIPPQGSFRIDRAGNLEIKLGSRKNRAAK